MKDMLDDNAEATASCLCGFQAFMLSGCSECCVYELYSLENGCRDRQRS